MFKITLSVVSTHYTFHIEVCTKTYTLCISDIRHVYHMYGTHTV